MNGYGNCCEGTRYLIRAAEPYVFYKAQIPPPTPATSCMYASLKGQVCHCQSSYTSSILSSFKHHKLSKQSSMTLVSSATKSPIMKRAAETGASIVSAASGSTGPASPSAKKQMLSTTAIATLNDNQQHGGCAPADPPMLVKKLSENAQLPTRGSAQAAGYDLYR